MKKTFAILFAGLLLAMSIIGCLSMAVGAEETTDFSKNVEKTINGCTTAPNYFDGRVTEGEYGEKFHSVDYTTGEFLNAYDVDESVKGDFYATWDREYLYMAWVVYTDIHVATDDESMWKHCCIQLLTTSVNPLDTLGYSEYSFSILDTGDTAKFQHKAEFASLKVEDWDVAGTRDVTAKTTTYELRLPWTAVGVTNVGNGAVFGLSYSINDQEEYDSTDKNTQNMCEWQDTILGGKYADRAAIIYLAGGNEREEVSDTESNEPILIKVDNVVGYQASFIYKSDIVQLYTPFYGETCGNTENSLQYQTLAVIDWDEEASSYKIISVDRAMQEKFDVVIPENGFIVSVGTGSEFNMLFKADRYVAVSDENIDDARYLVVTKEPAAFPTDLLPEEPSVAEESSELEASSADSASSAAEESSAEVSAPPATSATASTAASKDDASKDDSKDGLGTGAIIAIVVAAVAVVAIVVVIVIKKKKQ